MSVIWLLGVRNKFLIILLLFNVYLLCGNKLICVFVFIELICFIKWVLFKLNWFWCFNEILLYIFVIGMLLNIVWEIMVFFEYFVVLL